MRSSNWARLRTLAEINETTPALTNGGEEVSAPESLFRQLIGNDLESGQQARAEIRAERDIGGVTPPRHEDTSDTGAVMPRVEGVPAVTEIDLEPPAEIHRCVRKRHADIAEIPGAVPCRDVHASAQGDREVGEIPAHAGPLHINIPRGFCRARMLVAEADVVVDEIADRLDPLPARRHTAEQRPRGLRKQIRLAIPATQKKDQVVVRQGFDRVLLGIPGDDVG